MRLEGPRRGAAVQRLQHRRLHFQVPLGVEESPDAPHDLRPQPHEPSRERVPRGLVVARIRGDRLLRARGTLEPVRKRRDAALQQLFQLLAPRRFDEPGGHAALLPNRFKNASMNGSRSPSITLWTSLTFSSVRWSFTIV